MTDINHQQLNKRPILYSLRHCPFAMRARLAIFRSQLNVELRSIVLNDKPDAMLAASPKGTVPVLVLPQPMNIEPQVIDESFDIMVWALQQQDPDDVLHCKNREQSQEMFALVQQFDNDFKGLLEQYKCAKRYHETDLTERRDACVNYISDLEIRLEKHRFLISNKESLADLALLPFIRQFARVERAWYLQSPYPNLKRWLNNYLQSPLFTKIMAKHPLYLSTDKPVYFGSLQ